MSEVHVSLGNSLTPLQKALLLRKLGNVDGVSDIPLCTCGKEILICYDGLPNLEKFN